MYSQQKFNLLREESEGYSKLVVELEQGQGLTEHNVERVSNNVQALVAYFNLDPNRVLDVMLDCYESALAQPLYCHIVRKFCPSSLIHVLGFKFQVLALFFPCPPPSLPRHRLPLSLVTASLSPSSPPPSLPRHRPAAPPIPLLAEGSRGFRD